MMKIRCGFGYWDITKHPIGGCFRRVTGVPLNVTGVSKIDIQRGCDSKGVTDDFRTICFHSAHAYGAESEAQ